MKSLSNEIDLGNHPHDYIADGLIEGWYFVRWGKTFSRADVSIRYDSEDAAMVAFNTDSIKWNGEDEPSTTITVSISFEHNWGGSGNILQVLTAIRKLEHLGVVDVELTQAEVEPLPMVLTDVDVGEPSDFEDMGQERDDWPPYDDYEELPDDTEQELADFYGNPYGRDE